MPLERQYELTTVVVKAPVAPLLFTPEWLLAHDVIGERDYRDVTDSIVTPQFAQHVVDWFTIVATPEAVQLQTDHHEETGPLRDVAILVLRALRGTPVSSLGINRSCHFDVGGRQGADRVGDSLAPKEMWGSTLRFPGMLSLSTVAVRDGLAAGRVNVKVEPSRSIPDGVFVDINDHFALYDLDEPVRARDQVLAPQDPETPRDVYEADVRKRETAITVLQQEWNATGRRAAELVERVYTLSGAPR